MTQNQGKTTFMIELMLILQRRGAVSTRRAVFWAKGFTHAIESGERSEAMISETTTFGSSDT